MKTNLLVCLAVIASQSFLVVGRAADTADNRGQLSAADYKFAKEIAQDGMAEINLGNLAAANSQTTTIQQFGLRMVKDHGKVGKDLTDIAFRKGATLPTQLTTRQQKEVDKLAAYAGPEFDKAYLKLMIKDHKADEKLLNRASAEVQDSDLKAFAALTLPTVQDHLKAAQDLDLGVKHELSLNR